MSQGDRANATGFPRCRECDEGVLVPLSDFGAQGAPVTYKAWVCINPTCGFNVKIRNGEVMINEPVGDARAEPRHSRGGPDRDRDRGPDRGGYAGPRPVR